MRRSMHNRPDRWELDRERRVLTLKRRSYSLYEVDLDTCNTSAGMLDWIMQVRKKAWATDALIGTLVRALNDLLDPQHNICSGGMTRKENGLDVKTWLDARG